jgi:hypothetical protein
MALAPNRAQAQSARDKAQGQKEVKARGLQLMELLAQAVPRRRGGFALMPSGTGMSAAAGAVTGSGTPGRISKWAGVSGSSTYVLGDSSIFEDKFGRVGIGTNTPTSTLTIAGQVEITLGGLKFPDGTVQTTAFNPNQAVRSLNGLTGNVTLAAGANITITPSGNTLTVAAANALTGVAHDATLTGNGTQASPLSVVQPIIGNQTTTLLFPFVTNQAGFDTGIVITNTSLDTAGTAPQPGTCTVSYFSANGGTVPPPQTTNAAIPGGGQLTFTLSTGGNLGIGGAPGFQGYIMATCNFQYAHGFALITDGPLGAARIAGSYLALIVPAGPRNPNGEALSH